MGGWIDDLARVIVEHGGRFIRYTSKGRPLYQLGPRQIILPSHDTENGRLRANTEAEVWRAIKQYGRRPEIKRPAPEPVTDHVPPVPTPQPAPPASSAQQPPQPEPQPPAKAYKRSYRQWTCPVCQETMLSALAPSHTRWAHRPRLAAPSPETGALETDEVVARMREMRQLLDRMITSWTQVRHEIDRLRERVRALASV